MTTETKRMAMVAMLGLTGCSAMCGRESVDNEAIGQVKRVHHNTPLLCGEFNDVDLSLGVMKNGQGSMSTQDKWFNASGPELEALLVDAAQSGAIVRIKYDTRRVGDVCRNSAEYITHAEIVK